jgi:hypothetical protein
MPDGPRYEDDFFAWTQYQATVLRSLHVTDNRFDRDHVAEEIEDLGKSERDTVRSQVRRIIEHLLKLPIRPPSDRVLIGCAASRVRARHSRTSCLLPCDETPRQHSKSSMPTDVDMQHCRFAHMARGT